MSEMMENAVNTEKSEETKAEKFVRIGEYRMNKAIDAIGRLENLANKSAYEYTQEQAEAMFSVLEQRVAQVKEKFAAEKPNEGGFLFFRDKSRTGGRVMGTVVLSTGDKILNLMKEMDMGIQGLSALSGIRENTLLNVIAGISEPNITTACKIAGDYYGELMQDMSYAKEGSFLEELDELNVGLRLRETLAASIAYTLLFRCGADMDVWRDELNFDYISEFNTTMALSVIGDATTDMSEPLLMEIERTVADYDRRMARQKAVNKAREGRNEVQIDSTEKNPEKVLANAPETRYNALKRESDMGAQEKTATNHIETEGIANGTDIREERGLSDTQPDAGQRAGGSAYQVRADAQELSGGTPEGDLQRASDGGQTESALSGETEAGRGTDERADRADGGSGRRDGGTESSRSDEMGAADEQHQALGGGNGTDGAGLQPVRSESQQNRETEKPDNGEDSLSGSFLDNLDFAQKAMEIQKGVLCSDNFLIHKRPEIAGYFQMEQDASLQTEYFKNCFRFGTYYGLKVADSAIGFYANDEGIHINMTEEPVGRK